MEDIQAVKTINDLSPEGELEMRRQMGPQLTRKQYYFQGVSFLALSAAQGWGQSANR